MCRNSVVTVMTRAKEDFYRGSSYDVGMAENVCRPTEELMSMMSIPELHILSTLLMQNMDVKCVWIGIIFKQGQS